jgi:mRNA interferase RelE/StbE
VNSLRVEEGVLRFLGKLERKHAGQIAVKILALATDPRPADAKALQGTKLDLLRIDVGEFRVVYCVQGEEIKILLVGRRNDDEVYKELKRKGY